MIDVLDRLLANVPVDFFKGWEENTIAAFVAACQDEKRFDFPEQCQMRGQMRHAYCEKALRDAAIMPGLSTTALHTDPPGGCYTIVYAGDVVLLRCAPVKHCGPPRRTKFRKKYAQQYNAWLNFQQHSFFEPTPTPSPNQLCVMLIATEDRSINGDRSVPAFLGVGIPRHDLSDWAYPVMPLSDLIGHYHDADAASRQPIKKVPQVKDLAWPDLKGGQNEQKE